MMRKERRKEDTTGDDVIATRTPNKRKYYCNALFGYESYMRLSFCSLFRTECRSDYLQP